MKIKVEKVLVQIILLILLLLSLTGCAGEKSGFVFVPTPEGAKSVDILFREFYDHLGGVQVLGPAISPIFAHENRKYQYVQAGCMEYDLEAPASERFRLSPLGLELGVSDPPVPAPVQSDLVYVDGHVIYNGFVPLYRQLGGARFVGRPLSEVHYNQEKQRFEQYFENLGFYWMENDPPERVALLAYGAWKCDSKCRHQTPMSAQIQFPSLSTALDGRVFREVVARLGADFTGFALSDPFIGNAGKLEQVYENVVLVENPESPAQVSLQPLPEKIGIQPDPMTEYNGVEGMVFWPVESEQGYNVPQQFLDFITQHGGIEISGSPISELALEDDQIFRQCYTNLCLDYHLSSNIPLDLRIRPAPLGQQYLDRYYPNQAGGFTESQALRTISLQVWERYQFVGSNQAQEIGASIFEGKSPLRSIEPVLTLIMPDGSQVSHYFPPTGDDGQTLLRLDPIDAQNGTLIPYQVCISSLTYEMFCVKDSFVIWYNP
ncbi:MAG: hypothetical protein R6V73_07755 [Anaerolineales bacterium]|jgi:hypothetical protein